MNGGKTMQVGSREVKKIGSICARHLCAVYLGPWECFWVSNL